MLFLYEVYLITRNVNPQCNEELVTIFEYSRNIKVDK